MSLLACELIKAPKLGSGVKFVRPSDTLPEASADRDVVLTVVLEGKSKSLFWK
jgi:hypothetical protein